MATSYALDYTIVVNTPTYGAWDVLVRDKTGSVTLPQFHLLY